MNSIKSKAEFYFGISAALFGFSCLSSEGHAIALLVMAILFAMGFLFLAFSLWLRWRWLIWTAEQLGKIHFGHLGFFLGLASVATCLAQKGHGYLAIGVFAFAYISLILGFFPYHIRKRRA